ncbi:hemagglutinin repeat-containing protein [Vibrio diazotrophicus]|uniref:two-partner secretion domain-containing protein n=1 Tax=Vibrio diazotrophicus TaxID=685 RepID=UPI0022AEB242|nr:hemagglutinin repeat-containing protein [Vibrio diazotrophicus]MCZ4371320.1 hemagglutinin repeat-containing protein [Vibrio diazotrophicus]
MDRRLTVGKVCLTYGLCGIITLQPVFANVVIDNSAGNTSKSTAGNGVEVVNIATPNSQGLSHNQYQQFNVDPSGLILNNSTAQLAQSQLGGILQNNPNLQGHAASVILNEVTGANRSQLEGYTEVFGQQANVILANPYGITCDGCGFINTPRVTLSTGTPDIQNGLVKGFDVAEGSVTIEGLGLDATKQTYFDIISRTAEINASIHANELSIVTGRNHVDYQTNQVSKNTSSIDSSSPTLAIDSSSLGGMYAGRISLVATEDGVGVNVGNLVANTGDIVLTSDGRITLANASSANNIAISSQDSIELTGKQIADNQVALDANSLRLKQSTTVAGQDISIVAQNVESSDTHLVSGLQSNGVTNASATLHIQADGLSLSNSKTVSYGEIISDVADINVDSESSIVSQQASLSQLSQLNNQGEIQVADSLSVTGTDTTLKGVGKLLSKNVSVNVNRGTIDTTLVADNMTATASDDLTIGSNAVLSSTQTLNLKADKLNQNGQISAQEAVELRARSLAHSGVIAGKQDISITADSVNLGGAITSNQKLSLVGKEAIIGGNITAKQLDIDTSVKAVTATQAKVNVDDHAVIKTSVFLNEGELKVGNTLNIHAQDITQRGILSSADSIRLDSHTIQIEKDTAAQGEVNLIASGAITNLAKLDAGGDLYLSAQSLSNSGTLTSKTSTQVSTSQSLSNTSQGVISGHSTSVSASQLNNTGTLQSLDALNLSVASLINQGGIIALGDATLTSSGSMSNQGLLYAGNNANLYSNTLTNTADIVAGNNLLLAKNADKQRSSSITNSSGTIESLSGNVDIYTTTLANKRSVLDIRNTSTSDNRAYFTPVFIANGTTYEPELRVESESISNSDGYNNRTIYYHYIDSGETFTALAFVEGQKLLKASNAARIVAQGVLQIESNNVVNDASQLAASIVSIKANSLNNKAYTFSEYSTYYDYKLRTGYRPGSRWYRSWGDFIFDRTGTRKVNTGSSGKLNSSITATNQLTLNVANRVNNGTLSANATAVKPSKGQSQAKSVDTVSVSGPDIQYINTNDVPFPSFTFPNSPNGLFVRSPNPLGKYLIETNPLLTNMGQFLGSDYFIEKVGVNPRKDIKFLGDAFYDSRIISQSVFEQTGRQYLNQSVGSQLEQMQQLIDAAAAQKNALNLTSGVALSSSQIAQLTQDILWYEEVEVDGQIVLAPKLYLTRATLESINDGAQIAGVNVDINAGDVLNSGVLTATNVLDVNSANTITNDGGSIKAQGSVALKAQNDIINFSGDIQGGNITLESTNGSVVNETRVTQRSATLGRNSGTATDIGRIASIQASGALTISAGKNVENRAASIAANNNVQVSAGNDIVVDSKDNTNGYDVKHQRGRVGESNTSLVSSSIKAGGNLVFDAGNNIDVTASQLDAQSQLKLKANNDITIKAAQNKHSDHSYRSNRTEINRSVNHQGSNLSGSNVVMESGKDITLSGTAVSATDSVDMSAKGDVNILAVNDSSYHFDQTVSKKSFGRSSTTTNEIYREKVKGSSISAGDSISIKAQNLDSVVTAGGDSDINIIGSALNANNEVTLSADGDVTLAAQTYKEFERHETVKKGFGGLSGRNTGSAADATLLNSSYLINSGNTSIVAGKDIGVIASEVSSGGNINLNAVDEVLIAAGDVLRQTQQWDEKTSFLSGGNLFEMEKKRQGLETSTAQSSVIQSGGSLSVDAGAIKVIGSELTADENVSLAADTGDVEILAAKETSKRFESEEKLSIGLGTTTKMLMGDTRDVVKVEDGTIKASLGKATYDKVKQQTDAVNHKGSVVSAQNDLSIEAESSILVEGSTLASDTDGDNQGDLRLTANDDITIKEAIDTLTEQREEVHGKAEVSVVVQHQAVEVVKAALALKEATKKLKQAKEDFKQYQKQLDSLESTLTILEQEYQTKKPGVLFEDVEELRDLISEVKSDKAWYVAGVALASEDVVSKTTLLVQQAAAAAQSTGTYGFNAGLHLDVEASKTKASAQQTNSVGSQLSGQNIIVRAGDNEGNQANISGSTLAANDNLEVAANEVNIIASQDTYDSKSETQSGKIGASITVYGASSGINLNASFDRSQNTSSSLTHNNSQLNADNITITSVKDTNVKGATVNADESLTMNVGGDLNVSSVQDRYSSSQKGMGISGGLSLSDGATSEVTGASGGVNASNGRTRTKQTVVTSLTSGGTADINVANNTDLKGAVIATQNDAGKDTGQLNLTTNTFTFADLSNTDYNQNRSMGVSTSVGVNDGEIDSTNNSTSIQYKNTSGYSKSKTLATVGQGNLTIADSDNSHDLTALNRDIEQTEKDLFTVDRKQGDFDVTIDHRLLTEKGRAQIKEDVKRTHLAGQSLADVALEDSVKLADTFEHMDVVQKELDVQLLIAQKKGDAAVNINNLENAAAKQKQDAINDYAEAYSEVFGISIESALVIAVNKSIGGAHYTGDKGSNIVLNDQAMKNAQDYMNTLAHEVTHGLEKQGIIGKKGEQGENYAELIGGYAEGNYEFALENSGLGKVNKGNTNSHIGNDSKAVVDASEQFKTVQKSGAEVDYYLTQPEARRKAELTEFLLNCTDSSCRDTEEFKSKQKELVALNKKDEERDLAYKKACYSGGGEECNSESAKVVAAHDTWDKETAVKDSSLTSEYIDITSKNAEAEARPWELAAGSALAEMPTDALIDAISAVPEMVDLATTSTAAIQGDEGAQQQLKAMYESAVETMSDPNGAADKYIADIQAKEARGEISSFEAKKQISKFYISVAASVTGSAYGVVKLGDTSLNAIANAGDSVKDIVRGDSSKVAKVTHSSDNGSPSTESFHQENNFDLSKVEVLSIKDARKMTGKNSGLIFVQEPQGNFDKNFVQFESGTKGAFSDVSSERKAVPAIRFDNPNPKGNNFVKFDGIEDDGTTLIDRKTALTTFDKQLQSIQRVSYALKQNPRFKGVFEFPNQKAADKAMDILIRENITNITVRVAK